MRSARSFVALAFAGCASLAAAQPFPASGIDLRAFMPLSQLGSPAPTAGSSNWGYTSPSGREYVLMGTNTLTAFVEITNPTNPVLVGTITHPTSIWNEMKAMGTYCYNVNENSGGGAASGMQVINLANIDAGVVSLVRTVNSNGLSHSHTITVNPGSPYVYLNGSNAGGSGGAIAAFSLADPANPTFAGAWNGPYCHDSQVVTWTTGPFAGREIAFCFCEENGVYIVDVTNKAAMVTLGSTTYPGLQYCHQGWLSQDRRFVYINDELDGPNQGVVSSLTRVINVENLTAPFLANTFSGAGSSAVDHNLFVNGRYIYESNYTSGLRVFDAINPQAPVEVAWIDTHPENDSPNYNGTWNNYPYFASGNIAVADINRGLFIVKLNLDFLTFAFPNGAPTVLTPQQPTPIEVTITSALTPVDPATARLFYSMDGGAFSSVPLTLVSGNTYSGVLPGAPCLSTVRYYVQAANTSGVVFTNPTGAPASTYTATVNGGTTTLVSFTMETDQGWMRAATGDTATTGLWERGNPEGTAAQPEDDHTPAPGVNCWVTGRTAGAGVGANDIDGGFTTLLSPAIDLAGAPADTRIGYWRWYSNNAGSAPGADVFVVDVSSTATLTWVNAETVGPAGSGTTGGWVYHEFRLADFVPATSNVRLRFIAEDAAAGSVVEAALDDFTAFRFNCPALPCDPDFNCDGNADQDDVGCMINVVAGNPGCECADPDFNGDGNVDQDDVAAIINVVAGGPCP